MSTIDSRRWVGPACMLGGLLLVIHFVGETTINTLTPTLHSASHLLAFLPGLIWIGVLLSLKSRFEARLARLSSWVLIVGAALFALGNSYYAIFHGWFDIYDIYGIAGTLIFMGFLLLSVGGLLFGIALLQTNKLSARLAWLFILGALVLFPGWLRADNDLYKVHGPLSQLIALAIVLPYGMAWVWFGYKLSYLNDPKIA